MTIQNPISQLAAPTQANPRVIRIGEGRAQAVRIFAYILASFVIIFAAVSGVLSHFQGIIPLAVLPLTAIFVAIWLIRYTRRSRFEFGGGVYKQVGAWGQKTFTAADIEMIVTANAMSTNNPYSLGGRYQPNLFVFGKGGRRLMWVQGFGMWTAAQLSELAVDMIAHGARCEAFPNQVTSAEIHARYPKSMNWIAGLTRQGYITMIVVSGVVGFFVIFALILGGVFFFAWLANPAIFT